MSSDRRRGSITVTFVVTLVATGTTGYAAHKPALLRIFERGQHDESPGHRHPKDKCDHSLAMPDKKLKKGHDSIHWLIWNDCEDRPVLLCVYPTSPMNAQNPFDKCNGGDIGTPFLAKKGPAPTIVSCKAKSDATEGKYTKQALVGAEIPASKQCPPSPLPEPTPKGTVKTLAHTLDIVIEP